MRVSAGRSSASASADVLHEDRRLGRLAHRPDDLLVALVADQDHRVPVVGVAARLHVHLRDERAGRVDHVVPQRGGVRVHGRGDAVRRVDDRRARRHLGLLVDEDRAARLEVADDVDVVDDLLADVDRRAVVLERLLDRLDGALDPGAVAAGRCQENAFDHADRVSVAAAQPSARGLGEQDADEHDDAPDDLHRDERLAEPDPGDDGRGDGLERGDDPDRRRRQVLQRARSRARRARSCRARSPRARARRPAR